MAYRRTARKARSSNRRVSSGARRSVRRASVRTRRASGSRRAGGNTLRIVLEQPAANAIQRPDALDLKASQAAHAAVLANAKSKF